MCCADAYVMRDWAKQLGVSTKNVALLADGEGDYHASMGECSVLYAACAADLFLL